MRRRCGFTLGLLSAAVLSALGGKLARGGDDGQPQRGATTPLPGTVASEPIDDRAWKRRFEKQLAAVLEAGGHVSPDQLRRQLREREGRKITIRQVPGDPAAGGQRLREATLMLGRLYKCDRCDEWHGGIAGGVVISADGIVATNHHVISSESAAAFGAMDAAGRLYPVVEVLSASKKDDLALVRLKVPGETDLEPVPLASADGDVAGDPVRVLSHPDGRYFSLSQGFVSRYSRRPSNGALVLEITADYARGSSGCGVFNAKGELSGLVAATESVYYTESGKRQNDLQMVVRLCVPVKAIRSLVQENKAR